MIKRTALVGVMALALLAACSKQAPQGAEGASAGKSGDSAAPPPAVKTMSQAEKAAGLLVLIDPAPQCQPFRDQLDQAGKAPAGSITTNQMSQIVAEAHKAGCSRKPGQQ